MQPISIKTGLAAFLFLSATVTGGILTACSTTIPTQTQVLNTSNKQHSNHSSHMHHNMDLGPADANYDLRFIDAMIPHHQGAVDMAKEVLDKSQRPEMKKLAVDIISAQNREINQMKQWRKTWYADAPNTPMAYNAEMGHMMPMTAAQMQSMMMSMDLGKADAEFDLRFINAMIPHHEGALVMAQEALNKSQRPEMKKLAQDILSSQQKEIDQMKQWRQDWYKQ
jgi:uncharacterized protein (DUF305 family)